MPSMTENRRDPRAPIELEVVYQRLNSFFADYTKNVSRGGMFVKTARGLPVGSRFMFRLKLPSRPEPLELAADVVHVQQEGADAGMGLRFVWPDDAAKQAFDGLVEGLMAEQLGAEATRELLGGATGTPTR